VAEAGPGRRKDDGLARERPPLPGGPYLVVGLARSGVAAALALRARGEEVIGCDSGSAENPALAQASQRLSQAGVEVHLDASGDVFAARAGTLIKSPGVPQSEPTVVGARRRGIPVLGELELAWRLLRNEFIAVTGTNGKTTTSEWIGHIHREAGLQVRVVGNVGTAASSLAREELDPQATLVCEASSFQLEDTVEFAPEGALLLNLAPDHMDRHPSYGDYVSAKLRIFAHQRPQDVAVLPEGLDLEIPGRARRLRYGSGPEAELARHITLPGEHNRQNGMAAAAVCLARGIDAGAVAAGLASFPGVAHRLERIAVVDGVAYVNDSKATNVPSTIMALRAFSEGVHLIAGGTGKGQDFAPLSPLVSERCRTVYLIGAAASELRAALTETGIQLVSAGDLDTAVDRARVTARDGETVLLSPACASFDQYRDFEQRGEHFRSLVEAL
jgi:UDP-N-acetylmuramoylalanine--D-glutamate ligase